jgi:hypothetical protein
MRINKARRVTPRFIILLVLAGVVSYIVLVVAANLIVWHHNDVLNAQRLKILQADSILRCRIPTISPWHEQEEMNADTIGTTHGIGFGGRTQTSVNRLFSLNGTDPAEVVKSFTACAQTSGWMLVKQPYIALSGTKSFPNGWRAYMRIIYIPSHTLFTNQPILQVILDADTI